MGGRFPIHFGSEERILFGWYHTPKTDQIRDVGIIICNTLGNESLRLPRSLRRAAERMADAGFAVLRFDFYGTGDSSGEEGAGNQVEHWLADIELAVEELKRRTGLNKISLIGARLGATLAGHAAENSGGLEDLILWEPSVSGKEFLKETSRQHKILISLSPSAFTFDDTEGVAQGKEFLGFFINDATLSGLEKLDLLTLNRSPAENVLVLGAVASAGPAQKILDHLSSLGAKVEYRQAAGFQGIFREALLSELPFQVFDRLIAWLIERHGERHGKSAQSLKAPKRVENSFHEKSLFFGARDHLFGILTVPAAPATHAVIILNAGVGTRIGPHRLYVQMARAWAKLGFAVLRMDLSGSGDSHAETAEEECSPYPRFSITDAGEAITFLQEKYSIKRFVVLGICSGADIAFRAAAEDPRVLGAVIINPRSFCTYNFPELELHVRAHHLESTLKKGENWMKLLRSRSGAVTRITQVARSAALRVKQIALKSLNATGEMSFPAKDIPDCFRKILNRGSNVLLAVSDGDPGTEYVEIHFGKEMRALEKSEGFHRVRLKGTDHLFTLKYAREAVLKSITEYLLSLRTK